MAGQIFGSNITLPSLPDLQSDCEEEILLLMREVDLEFQRKHYALLEELDKLRSLCRTQSGEIENLRCILQGNSKILEKENSSEKIKQYSNEIEMLKKENLEIKAENKELKSKTWRLTETQLQLESLKRSLSNEQDENKRLRERLSKADEKNQSLQSEIRTILDKVSGCFSENVKNQERYQVDAASSEFKEMEINKLIEKFSSEDEEFYQEMFSKLNSNIDELGKNLSK